MAGERESSVRDHLANEPTLLAWVRTALTVVGLGFVIARFTASQPANGSAILLGTALAGLGGVIAAGAAYRFLRTARQIETGHYRPTAGLLMALAVAVVLGALAVMAYLLLA